MENIHHRLHTLIHNNNSRAIAVTMLLRRTWCGVRLGDGRRTECFLSVIRLNAILSMRVVVVVVVVIVEFHCILALIFLRIY